MTDRDDLRVDKALQGADFPSSKSDLLDYVRTRGADQKTLQAMDTIPDQEFGNKQEVIDAVAQEPEGTDVPGGTAR